MMRKFFFLFIVLMLAAFFAEPFAPPTMAAEPASGTAFSSDPDDWHSIVADFGSSALVRIYGKIISTVLPTDIYVGVSENMSSVRAWVGNSEGNEPRGGGDVYLVIEGQAEDAERAANISVDFVCYRMEDVGVIQTIDLPVRGRTTNQGQDDSGGSGCSSGAGGVVAVCALAASAFVSGRKR